jgi:hypothetical protein
MDMAGENPLRVERGLRELNETFNVSHPTKME